MPLAELTLTRGAVPEPALRALVRDITEVFLDAQRARCNSEVARSIACLEVREIEPGRFFVGGEPAARPRYRLAFTTPEGALDPARKAALVEQATRLVLAAEGTPFSEDEAHRVWCIIHEVPDGNWASAGRIWRWRDITRWVLRGEVALRRLARARTREPARYAS